MGSRELNAAEWPEYRTAIVEALRDYPEARTALIEALRRECGHIELAHDLALALALDAGRLITMKNNGR